MAAKILMRFLLLALILAFIFGWQEWSCWFVVASALGFGWVILSEHFQYSSATKYSLHDGLFMQDSQIGQLLSGKMLLTLKALLFSGLMLGGFMLNLTSLDNFQIMILPLGFFIFLGVRKVVNAKFTQELRYGEQYAKKWIFGITAVVMVLVYMTLLYLFQPKELFPDSYWDYITTLNYDPVVNCWVLEHLHAWGYYIEKSKDWLIAMLQGYSNGSLFGTVLALLVIGVGYFLLFFVAAHFYSWLTSMESIPEKFRPGWFFLTLLILCAIYATLQLAGFIGQKTQSQSLSEIITSEQSTAPEKRVAHPVRVFRFMLSGLESVNVPKQALPAIRAQIQQRQEELVARTKTEISHTIARAFGASERRIASEMADWYFSILTDYAVLALYAVGSSEEYISEQFRAIVQANFPSDINQEYRRVFQNAEYAFQSNLQAIIKSHQTSDSNVMIVNQTPMDWQAMQGLLEKSTERSLDRLKVKGGLGGVTATAVGVLTTKASFKAGGKLLAKSVAKAGIKGGTKLAGAAAGAGLGLSCGPFAPICSSVGALVGWVGVDYAVTKGDEVLHREEFEREIIEALRETQREVERAAHQEVEAHHAQMEREVLGGLR